MIVEIFAILIISLISSLTVFFNLEDNKDLVTALKVYLKPSFVKASFKYYIRSRFRRCFDIGESKTFKCDGKKYIEITYYDKEEQYKIILEIKKSKECTLIKITDALNNDITYKVKKYMGIDKTFNGVDISPKLIGETEINFHFLEGEIKTFKGTEIIKNVN